MLPLKHRLMLRQSPTFFSQSKKLYSPLYTVFYLVTNEHVLSTGAVVVPKKVLAKATDRNKVKRQCLEILYPLLKSTSNLQIAIRIKRPLEKKDIIQLSQDLAKL